MPLPVAVFSAPLVALLTMSPMAAAQQAFTLRDAGIVESSGLATSSYDSSLVLTHNDSGGAPEYFLVDTRTGATVARVHVPGAKNVDWEDIAVSGHTVYLADIGDNRGTRRNVTIYAMPEPRRGAAVADRPSAVTRLTYSDGPRDAEALLVPPGGLPKFVVTKQLFGARVYTIDGPRLRHLADLGVGLITGGSWSPDGAQIALVSYTGIFVYDAATFPAGEPRRLELPPLRQAESITWDGNAAVLVGSEGVHSPVYRVAVPQAEPSPATALPSPATSSRASASPASASVPPSCCGVRTARSGKARFSRTVIPGKSRRPSGTRARPRRRRWCGGRLCIGSPSSMISP